MILTCPECATGYFVDDSQIRAGGRKVRCANCGARWMAHPEGPLELVTSEEGAVAREASPPAESAPLTGDELPRVFRDRAEDERRMRRAAATGAAWAAGAVAIVALIAVAVVFRDSVVRAWPPTASLYAAIGLPVNPTGLAIEQLHIEPALHGGHAALDVSGVIRNVVDHSVIAPPLRITIKNTQGKRVAGQIASLDNARIPPGGTRHFMTSILDPPYSAANLDVDFALDADGRPSATAVHSPAQTPPTPGFTLRGATGDTAAPANVTAPPADNAPAPPPAAAPAPAPVGR